MEVDRPLLFGDFSLDPGTRQLRRSGEVVARTPKAFTVLKRLVQDSGELISKDELLRAGWARTRFDFF
jgi:DNA-binding winged helix-turn-helix (wHTH) protein